MRLHLYFTHPENIQPDGQHPRERQPQGRDTNLATLSDLAGLSQCRNVDNEIYILQSRRLMTEVVKQLGLTVQYETKDGLRPQDLYGQSPIAVEFINDNDRQGFRFEVSLRPTAS